MRSKHILVTVLTALVVTSTAAARGPGEVGSVAEPQSNITVRGIVCEAVKKINGIAPMVIIKDITKNGATLMLDFNGTLPDIRAAVLDKTVNNGKVLVGYVSQDSEMLPKNTNFAVYTNGSTAQDTTKAKLTFEANDHELDMICRDGMAKN